MGGWIIKKSLVILSISKYKTSNKIMVDTCDCWSLKAKESLSYGNMVYHVEFGKWYTASSWIELGFCVNVSLPLSALRLPKKRHYGHSKSYLEVFI